MIDKESDCEDNVFLFCDKYWDRFDEDMKLDAHILLGFEDD